MKIAFLDRDGTLIQDYPDVQWASIDSPELIEGSVEACKLLTRLGYQLIIVTNQYLIRDGIITEEKFYQVHAKLLDALTLHGIVILDTFFCPHNDQDNCNCKKPNSGMIDSALTKYPEIDIENSIVFGDSVVDIGLAEHFGIKVYAIMKENKTILYKKCFFVASLYEGVRRLIHSK